jgi:Sensors of blue-light using FAD
MELPIISGETQALTSVVYVSSAVELFTPESLIQLLERARHNNARLGVTGMLLYNDGNFMQALEGPASSVSALFEIIDRDVRHRGVIQLMNYPTEERQFADWSMGFANLHDKPMSGRAGCSDILNPPFNSGWFRDDPTRAQRLLISFRRNM